MKPFFSPAGCSHFKHLKFPVLILSLCNNRPKWFNKVPIDAFYHILLCLENKPFIKERQKSSLT